MVKSRVLWVFGIVFTIGAFAGGPSAQAPPSPAFEVASVKQNKSVEGGGSAGFQPGGRFRAINFALRELIEVAFGNDRPLLSIQIVGGPDWIASDRFDIIAKMNGGALQNPQELSGQMPALLRTLLEDRFKLKTHRETRQLPVYALMLNRKDGQLGPQLRRSTIDCLARNEAARPDAPPAPPAGRLACGLRMGPGTISAHGLTMRSLIVALSRTVDRLVTDDTELTGSFDAELQWTPDRVPLGVDPSTNSAPSPDGPSVFTAVQEQLGLKLESTKGPVEVLVIDHVEQPTPD